MKILERFHKKFESFTVSMREDGIVQVTIHEGQEVTLAEVIEGTNYIMSIVKEQKFPVLFLAEEFSIPSKEAREYLAKKEALPYSKADAYVVCSFTQKLVGNFYLRVNKPARPTKLFNDKGEALEWLKMFK